MRNEPIAPEPEEDPLIPDHTFGTMQIGSASSSVVTSLSNLEKAKIKKEIAKKITPGFALPKKPSSGRN